jgi:hypothetical protein
MTVGDSDLGLGPHGPVMSDPIWCFVGKLKMTSHIQEPNLRAKHCLAFE